MRHFFIVTATVLLCGCAPSGQTFTNLPATLGSDGMAGDTPIVLLNSGTFECPRFARARDISGVVTVNVLAKTDGTASDIRVLKRALNKYRVWIPDHGGKSDDVIYIFDGVVQDMIAGSTWQPYARYGRAVDKRVTLPLNFKIE